MDIASAIAGILSLSDTIITRGTKYYQAVNGAQKEINGLMLEVSVLAGILGQLRLRVLWYSQEMKDFSSSIQDNHITSCDAILAELRIRLEKADTCGDSFAHRLMSNLIWPFTKFETEDMVAKLQRIKSDLAMALNADSLAGILKVLSIQEGLVVPTIDDIHTGQQI